MCAALVMVVGAGIVGALVGTLVGVVQAVRAGRARRLAVGWDDSALLRPPDVCGNVGMALSGPPWRGPVCHLPKRHGGEHRDRSGQVTWTHVQLDEGMIDLGLGDVPRET